MRWSCNPIALARLAVGGGHDQASRPWPDSWEAVQDLFRTVYKGDARAIFYGSGDTPSLLHLLHRVSDLDKPLTLREMLAEPEVKSLMARLANPEWMVRLLPFIATVTDMDFSPPGTEATLNDNPVIGSYEKIGTLEVDGVSWLDPEQGSTADCYLISTMISLAWARPRRWREVLSAATQGDPGTLHVTFNPGPGPAKRNRVDLPPSVPLDVNGALIYAHSSVHEETWPALLERAFVMNERDCVGDPTVKDYRDIGRLMLPHVAAQVLMGGETGRQFPGDTPFQAVVGRCPGSVTTSPTMAWTKDPQEAGASPVEWLQSTLIPGHAYAVLGRMENNGDKFVVLRNPFGNNPLVAGAPSGEWADGAALNGGAPVSLSQHGVFAIGETRFNAFFHAVDWLEAPPDPPA